MTEARAYAAAGVDDRVGDAAVAALVAALKRTRLDGPSRQVPLPGHYASVIRLDERAGLAMSTDTVGTKMLIAERLGRFDTIGIDCVAMNANDVVCVGAEPIAMLDFVLCGEADPEVFAELGAGLARGAELAGVEITGGEVAQVGEIVAGLELGGTCVGTVALEAIVDGARIEPGDPVIGLPSSGLHSNGYTLARKALADVPLHDERLGRPLGDALLEPTEIYVRAALDLLRSPADVRGLAHITGGGLGNLLRLGGHGGFEIDAPLPVPPILDLVRELGAVDEREMHAVFNMGCGFCCVVAADHEEHALDVLRGHYPQAQRIGRATDAAGELKRASR